MRSPLAITGIGLVLPGCTTASEVWRAFVDGTPRFRHPPVERWSSDVHGDPVRAGDHAIPAVPAAFVTGFRYDWKRFKMPPNVADRLNPMHHVLMHAASDALAQASASSGGERIGFALGTSGLGLRGDYGLRVRFDDLLDAVRAALPASIDPARAIRAARAAFDAELAPILEDNVLGAVASIAQGRVMNQFHLQGPHAAIDVGGASALAALDVAWEWIEAGDCEAFLVGGASAWLGPADVLAWSAAKRLASDAPRPFDQAAAGTLLGEGAVLYFVEPLARARARGVPVIAVVRGVGGATGAPGARVASPEVDTYVRAIRHALLEAALEPRQVGFVECHAAGLPADDRDELAALATVFGSTSSVALGSAKAVFGHLQGGAAALGLLKAVLAIERGVLPPQPRVDTPLPELGIATGPLHVLREPAPWRGGIAGVTAVADAGTVYHAIIEREDRARHAPRAEPLASSRVAIVGLGAVVPDAANIAAFWQNNLDAHDAVREVPIERFDVSRYSESASSSGDERRQFAHRGKGYTRLGAFVPQIAAERDRYRVPPASLPQLDRTQRLAVDATLEAIRDAAAAFARSNPDRIAVIAADAPQREREMDAASRAEVPRLMDALDRVLVELHVPPDARAAIVHDARGRFTQIYTPVTEDSLLGFAGSAIASRVAGRLGARAVAIGMESACASALIAIGTAIKWLARKRYDVVVVVGVSASMSPEVLMSVCAFNGVSARGIAPFDARGDGFVVGEGAAALVLERVDDAVGAGDHVYAVLRGCGASSDGEGRSIFPPNSRGQAESCRRALHVSGVRPDEIDYIECHGTGTPIGDVCEVEAYAAVYGGHGRASPIALGSVKSLIGHLNAAAGAIGVARTALALHYRVLPPSLHCEQPNPLVPFAKGPFEVNRHAQAWPDHGRRPRRAAVSAFGLGGSNAHVIVEEYAVMRRVLDEVATTAPARRFVRTISQQSDPYLEDHLVGGVPVVPGAMGCELVAQAAREAYPHHVVIGVEDVAFRQLLRVPPGTSVTVEATVRSAEQRGNTIAVHVELRSPVAPRGGYVHHREHTVGMVLLARAPRDPERVAAEFQALADVPCRDYAPLYRDHVTSYLGPRLRSIRGAAIVDARTIVARLEPRAEHDVWGPGSPSPLLPPLLLDNYFQVAGTLGVYHDRHFPLPIGVERVRIYGDPPAPGGELWVVARLEHAASETIRYRADVFDDDGWLAARLDGFHTRSIEPFGHDDLCKFFTALVGRHP